eukprot:Skav227819  [mRNA]  locus=scaffold948:259225:259707:+ [translate_table: standard]
MAIRVAIGELFIVDIHDPAARPGEYQEPDLPKGEMEVAHCGSLVVLWMVLDAGSCGKLAGGWMSGVGGPCAKACGRAFLQGQAVGLHLRFLWDQPLQQPRFRYHRRGWMRSCRSIELQQRFVILDFVAVVAVGVAMLHVIVTQVHIIVAWWRWEMNTLAS